MRSMLSEIFIEIFYIIVIIIILGVIAILTFGW